jgi:hypothetical protein
LRDKETDLVRELEGSTLTMPKPNIAKDIELFEFYSIFRTCSLCKVKRGLSLYIPYRYTGGVEV